MVMFKISILLILLGFNNKNEPISRLMIWLIQNKKLILRETIMDHDFIVKKLIKEIHEAQEKVECVDGFHNAMYHRGRIEGLKSAIRWIEADKWANEIFEE